MLIPVVLGVSLLIFTLMYFVPGNLAQIMLGQSATQDQIVALEEQLGLNDPYIEQLGRFLSNTFLKFDANCKCKLDTRMNKTCSA